MSHPTARRGWMRAAAAVAVVSSLALTACASGATSADPANPTLAIGLTTGVESIDPHAASIVRSSSGVAAALYSSLVSIDADQNVKPDLAQSWEQIDTSTYRFTLNPDAVFSDGVTPVTAETVVWNFDRLLDPANALAVASYLKTFAGAEVVDEYTVDVKLTGPDVGIFVALPYIRILDPNWTEENDPAIEAFGSGPYVLDSFAPSGEIVLSANENYWGTAPEIKNVTYSIYGSATAEANALASGEINFAGDIEPRDIERLENVAGLELENAESIRAAFLKFNTELAPLDDVRVRQALNYGVDKEAIAETLLLGTTEPSERQVLTDYFPGFDENLEAFPYDTEKAKALLAEAGYADGLTLETDVPSASYVEGENVTTAIAQQLESIGVTLNINVIPFATYMQKYTETNDLAQTAYLTQSQMSTDRFLGLFESTSVYAYWNNPEFDAYVNQGRFAETEEAAAAAYLQAVNVMAEEAPVLFLFPQPKIFAISDQFVWDVRDDEWVIPQDFSLATQQS